MTNDNLTYGTTVQREDIRAARAVLAALRANRIQLVELPEADEPDGWAVDLPRYRGTGWVYLSPSGTSISYPQYANTPQSARAMALALLAAAAAAEEEQ